MGGHTDKGTFVHKPEGTKEIIPRRKWPRQSEKYRGGFVFNVLKKQQGCAQGKVIEDYSKTSKTEQFI